MACRPGKSASVQRDPIRRYVRQLRTTLAVTANNWLDDSPLARVPQEEYLPKAHLTWRTLGAQHTRQLRERSPIGAARREDRWPTRWCTRLRRPPSPMLTKRARTSIPVSSATMRPRRLASRNASTGGASISASARTSEHRPQPPPQIAPEGFHLTSPVPPPISKQRLLQIPRSVLMYTINNFTQIASNSLTAPASDVRHHKNTPPKQPQRGASQ